MGYEGWVAMDAEARMYGGSIYWEKSDVDDWIAAQWKGKTKPAGIKPVPVIIEIATVTFKAKIAGITEPTT